MDLFIFLLTLVSVYGLKLTLKQDMSKLQEQLCPNEIGQFLHSINNLPSLAEFLDPSRSHLNFDFYHYYNNYGCADVRVFNMKRILKILSYGGLSRADKLILLNGSCLSRWPGFLSIQPFNLKYFLNVLPELNPILFLKDESQDTLLIDIIIGNRKRWNIIIEHATMNRDLNFIPGVDFLFEKEYIKASDFESLPYFNLIGPTAIDYCFQNSREAARTFVYNMEHYYNNLSPREIFYWTLNIGNSVKYQMNGRNIFFLKSHFDKLIRACPWDELVVPNFIKAFSSKLILKIRSNNSNNNRSNSISNESILEIFEKLIISKEPSPTTTTTTVNPVNEDYDFYAVEFFKWLSKNLEYFEIDENYLNTKILKEIIFKSISTGKNKKYADYFLNLFIEKRQFSRIKDFKKFLKENYDPSRPSHELIKAFRHLSWISGGDGGFKMTQAIKSFLDYDFRSALVRKLSFDHLANVNGPATIDIYFGDDEIVNISMFNCVFDSLMNHNTLVYPLEVDIITSGSLQNLFKESIDLKTIIQKFWNMLADYSNGFMKLIDTEVDEDDRYYLSEFIPNPWTHPNILLVMGRVMTLAFLNGIKLNGWRLKKTIFRSVFKINLTSIYESEVGRIEEFEKGQFLMFYTLNDYIKEIETLDDSRIFEGLLDLMNLNKSSLKPQTRKAFFNYRNNLLKKDRNGYYTLKSDHDQVWSSKIFNLMEESTSEDFNIDNADDLLEDLTPHLFEMNLKPESIEEDLLRITKRPPRITSSSSSIKITERDAAKVQIYSLYLGLQPLTRFMKSNEVYEALFIDE